MMKSCRECQHQISEQAIACPQCGAPYPAREKWDDWGFEYKSNLKVLGLPLVHIAFRSNGIPVVAKGILAIGQFGSGIITISQFGIGVFSLSQFTVAGWALAQVAIAYSLVAQFGLYVHDGQGQLVFSVVDWVGQLF